MQIPVAHRQRLLVRGDSAATSHAVLDWLVEQGRQRGRSLQYSVGWTIGEAGPAAIAAILTSGWSPTLDADGGMRDGGQVAS